MNNKGYAIVIEMSETDLVHKLYNGQLNLVVEIENNNIIGLFEHKSYDKYDTEKHGLTSFIEGKPHYINENMGNPRTGMWVEKSPYYTARQVAEAINKKFNTSE